MSKTLVTSAMTIKIKMIKTEEYEATVFADSISDARKHILEHANELVPTTVTYNIVEAFHCINLGD